MSDEEIKGPQFGMATMMWGVAVCSVVFGILASMDTTYQVAITCQRVPLDDTDPGKLFSVQDGVKKCFRVAKRKCCNHWICKTTGLVPNVQSAAG